jgi:antirestriction protein
LSGVPDDVARYFDWAAWTRDLAFDYTVEDAPGGGVFVFRNL